MDSSMEAFYSASCVPSMDCNTCLQYSFCVFIILLKGSTICASRTELRDKNYAFEKILFSSMECLSRQNLQNWASDSYVNDPVKRNLAQESQKKLISDFENDQKVQNLVDEIQDLKKQIQDQDSKLKAFHSLANLTDPNTKLPDYLKVVESPANIVLESLKWVQNSIKINQVTQIFVSNLTLTVFDKKQNVSKLALPLKTVRDGLLADYSAISKPPQDSGEALLFQTWLFLNSLELNETDSKFKIRGVLALDWIDTRLSFPEIIKIDSEMPDNDVYYEFHQIWYPEVTFDDGTNEINLEHHLIHSNNRGLVVMDYILNINSNCPLNMLYWPFDFQTCAITATMNSFTNKDPVQLYFLRKSFKEQVDSLELDDYSPDPNSEWDLISTSIKRVIIPCEALKCSDPVVKIHFIFKFKRISTRFVILHNYSILYSMLTTTFVLLCKPFSKFKVFLAKFNFTVSALILFIISQSLPFITKKITIHGLIFIVNAIVTLYSVMIVLCIDPLHAERPPERLRRILGIPVVRFLEGQGLPPQYYVPMDLEAEERGLTILEWYQIASVLDLLAFGIYVFLILILALFRNFNYFYEASDKVFDV